jgi:hypothetical protein
MTDREIDIIDAVGKYVDNKFEGKGRLDGSYIEEAQDYFMELQERVEDSYNERFILSPMLLNKLIKEVAQEMETDQRAIETLKYHLK